MFNIIARATLIFYCENFPEAKIALLEWYHEFSKYSFKNFNELKQIYANASLIGDDRVIFNIMGNKYRLIVRIVFEYKAVQIKWFGTHNEYDKVDVLKIQHKK